MFSSIIIIFLTIQPLSVILQFLNNVSSKSVFGKLDKLFYRHLAFKVNIVVFCKLLSTHETASCQLVMPLKKIFGRVFNAPFVASPKRRYARLGGHFIKKLVLQSLACFRKSFAKNWEEGKKQLFRGIAESRRTARNSSPPT